MLVLVLVLMLVLAGAGAETSTERSSVETSAEKASAYAGAGAGTGTGACMSASADNALRSAAGSGIDDISEKSLRYREDIMKLPGMPGSGSWVLMSSVLISPTGSSVFISPERRTYQSLMLD